MTQNGVYSVAITPQNFNDSNVPPLEVSIINRSRHRLSTQNVTLINGKVQIIEFDVSTLIHFS